MSKHPQWALKHKKKGTELRLIKGHYYLYEITSKWDPEKKRAKKITLGLLGKITENEGFIESDKHKLKTRQNTFDSITVKEYGITTLIENNFSEYNVLLKKYFPEHWGLIQALSYCRLVHRSPLKNCQYYYSKSYLSEINRNPGLSKNFLSKKLKEIGIQRQRILDFFKEFKIGQDHILFDGTDMLSNSKKMTYPQKSRSKKGTFENLINLMFVFSVKQKIPVYYRILSGNIKDISSFKLCLNESEITDALIIADKGFYSQSNVEKLQKEKLKYIIPLKRNSSLINYRPIKSGDLQNFGGHFKHEKRIIWYHETHINNNRLIIYKDDNLKAQEVNDYLRCCESLPEIYNETDFFAKQYQFGTIAILTNAEQNVNAEEVYANYKTRNQIENMIDVFKNTLDADKSYMQNEDALEGWIFVNYIAMHWYYKIIDVLKKRNLHSNYSPKDIIAFLSNIKKVKINGKWHNAEITKKELKLFDDLKTHIT